MFRRILVVLALVGALLGFARPAFAGDVVTAPSGAVTIVPYCVTGQITAGSVSVSFSGSTATAIPAGWSSCGEPLTGFSYQWNTGSTSSTTSFSPGQILQVTVEGCDSDFGCGPPGVTQTVTAPGGGSGTGGGCTSNCGGGGTGGGSGGSPPAPSLGGPTSAFQGDTIYLTTGSTGGAPSSCSMQPGNVALQIPLTGSYRVSNIQTSTTFTLACSNAYGSATSRPLTVNVTAVNLNTPLNADYPTDLGGSEVAGPTRGLSSGTISTCPSGARWKTGTHNDNWGDGGFLGAIFGGVSETVEYGVCYFPGGQIVFANVYTPFNLHASGLWSWVATSDPGFPNIGPLTAFSATFRWQGTASLCLFSKGCGPARHPGVSAVFNPANDSVKWGSQNG